ncbi:EF-hand domain-containing protein [Alteromonas sediminis]|uniref:EF-hand domain-containing protein n=1 Tax=Alteromonas sediminis TaxID=2259342 RepID=A0A3N5Y338_9ALTE|nr:EF-hand domain-containing protein [Alteromonas sediminis]RPJ67523.1 EF-hand domain-containing protein [Alteromonas sediminis]
MDTQLSDQKVEEIRKDFTFFDRDGNGQIDLSEFVEMLTVLSPKTKVSVVEEGFRLIDTNDDGYIDFEEFLEWWQECWWEY